MSKWRRFSLYPGILLLLAGQGCQESVIETGFLGVGLGTYYTFSAPAAREVFGCTGPFSIQRFNQFNQATSEGAPRSFSITLGPGGAPVNTYSNSSCGQGWGSTVTLPAGASSISFYVLDLTSPDDLSLTASATNLAPVTATVPDFSKFSVLMDDVSGYLGASAVVTYGQSLPHYASVSDPYFGTGPTYSDVDYSSIKMNRLCVGDSSPTLIGTPISVGAWYYTFPSTTVDRGPCYYYATHKDTQGNSFSTLDREAAVDVGADFSMPQICTKNTGGTANCVIPAGVHTIMVEAWGAGGGGSGSLRTAVGGHQGTGGGAGGYARSVISVVPGETLTMSVGAGGAGGIAGGGNGSAGGDTQLLRSSTPLITAQGGGGGTYAGLIPGAGGGGTGDVVMMGNTGGVGSCYIGGYPGGTYYNFGLYLCLLNQYSYGGSNGWPANFNGAGSNALGGNGGFLRVGSLSWYNPAGYSTYQTSFQTAGGAGSAGLIKVYRLDATPVTAMVSYIGAQSGVFTVPAGVTRIRVEIWGPGQGSDSTTTFGEAGNYRFALLAVNPGDQIPFTVGLGGGKGAGCTNLNGTPTTFGSYLNSSDSLESHSALLSYPSSLNRPGWLPGVTNSYYSGSVETCLALGNPPQYCDMAFGGMTPNGARGQMYGIDSYQPGALAPGGGAAAIRTGTGDTLTCHTGGDGGIVIMY